MFKLFVSWSCGISYHQERSAETIAELEPRMKELDEQYIRYYVEDEKGDMDISCMCNIHKSIHKTMEQLSRM